MEVFSRRASRSDVAFRLYLTLEALMFSVFALVDHKSLLHDVMEWAGALGYAVTLVMAIVAVFAIADAVINDLLPKRFSLPCALYQRYLLLMLLAFGYAIHLTWAVRSPLGAESLALLYMPSIVAFVVVAFLDVYLRFRKVEDERLRSEINCS